MSRPESPTLESKPEALREGLPDLAQRQFLKKLAGSAAGIAGLAVASELLNPRTAEAAYTVGGAPTFPSPNTTGDLVNTNLRVDGHLAVKGYRPWIDVTAYGAVGDWTQFCDTAVQNAFNDLPPAGGVIYFPPGVYQFEGPINCVNKDVAIVGAGRRVTLLYWRNPEGGFDISLNDPAYKVTIRDLSLQARVASTTPAIRITSSWTGGPTVGAHIHDIYIDGWQLTGSWIKGIELINVSGAKIERFDIIGGGAAASPAVTTHGIHLRGSSTITNISAGLIFNVGTGIEVSDISEGAYIRGVEVVVAEIGYHLNSQSPGSAISDCHAAARQFGIKLLDHGELALTGNLLYAIKDSFSDNNWVGIYAQGTGQKNGQPDVVIPAYGAHRLRIIGNCINTLRDGNLEGIRLIGYASDCTIQGNVLQGMTNGIILTGPHTDGNIVLGNRIRDWTAAATINVGNNLIVNNLI